MILNSVNIKSFTYDEWFCIASRIDNEFIPRRKYFEVVSFENYYLLCTTSCDNVSNIRVYFNSKNNIDKIMRLGPDTETWQEIHTETYNYVEQDYFKLKNKNDE